MTYEEMIAVIKAYAEGKKIEWCCREDGAFAPWRVIDFPGWNFADYRYRIKAEPKIRPWRDDEVPVGCLVRGDWGRAVLTHLEGKGEELQICCPDGTEHGRKWYVQVVHRNGIEHSTDRGKTWKICGVEE